jgi:hypothetical protein
MIGGRTCFKTGLVGEMFPLAFDHFVAAFVCKFTGMCTFVCFGNRLPPQGFPARPQAAADNRAPPDSVDRADLGQTAVCSVRVLLRRYAISATNAVVIAIPPATAPRP